MMPPAGRRPGGMGPESDPPAQVPRAKPAPAPAPVPAPVPALAPRQHRQPRRQPQAAMTEAQRQVTPQEEAAFATLETEVGGRQALVSILATATLPKGMDQVLGMIADPLHDHESLARVCALGGVKIGALLKVFEEAALTRGRLLATTRIAKALPDVAAGVMEAATPGEKTCRACLGAGRVPQPTAEDPNATQPCGPCKGTGLVYYEPDHEVQKTALKLGRLLDTGRQGPGVGVSLNVLQQQTALNPGDTGSYDTLVKLLDTRIYGEGRERLASMRPRQQQTVLDVTPESGSEQTGAQPGEQENEA